MTLLEATKALHWLGWIALPGALVTYPFVLLDPRMPSEGARLDPWTSLFFHGAMLAGGIGGYGCRRLGIRLYHGPRGRQIATRWDALRYLVVNALAIGGYGFMTAVPLLPCFQGIRDPWLAVFGVVGLVSAVSCCPALWPPDRTQAKGGGEAVE